MIALIALIVLLGVLVAAGLIAASDKETSRHLEALKQRVNTLEDVLFKVEASVADLGDGLLYCDTTDCDTTDCDSDYAHPETSEDKSTKSYCGVPGCACGGKPSEDKRSRQLGS